MPAKIEQLVSDKYTTQLKDELHEFDHNGVPPSILTQYYLTPLLNPVASQTFNVAVRGENATILKYDAPNPNNSVLASISCLTKGVPYGINVELIGDILYSLSQRLSPSDQKFKAILFPVSFQVHGQLTGLIHRSHFNHLLIYRDGNNQINFVIIDSTVNPIGIENPLPIIGYFIKRSIISGETLLTTDIANALSTPNALNALQTLFGVPCHSVTAKPSILTGAQPSLGDKKCGLFVVNTMAHLIDHFRYLQMQI